MWSKFNNRDARSQFHPSVAQALRALIVRMGFKDVEDYDYFFRQINKTREGEYVPFAGQEDDPRVQLIQRALSGEQLDTKAIYRRLGYEVR